MKKTKLWENGTPYYRPEYGQDEPALVHYIDLGDNARPDRDRPGCVIVFPGGAYHVRADYEGEPVAQSFNRYGIKSFVLEYRLYPYHHPAMLSDALRAVRWVRYHADELMIDPTKIAVLGFSAGGHLATTAITMYDDLNERLDEVDEVSSRPDAGLLCYAVISLQKPWTDETTKAAVIGDAEDPEALEKRMTGYLNVTDDTPPAFIWHTTEDPAVPQENALMMASALAAKKRPYELHVFMKGGHGTGLATDEPGNNTWSDLAAIWLQKLGF